MKKVPCDIYSRVTGYFQPVRFWNPGKKSEFRERHINKLPEGLRSEIRNEMEKETGATASS